MRGMRIVWTVVAVLCAVAFGFVTGVFNQEEKVNSLWLVVAAACFHVLAFRFYGRFLARRVAGLNDRYITPAHRLEDGTNYYPANKYVLFGHHFAAIAGAGPLLGPVLAAQFGYLPGFLWLVIVALLALIVLTDSIRKWYGYLVQGRPYTSTEVLGLADAQPNMVVAGGEGITLPGGRCCRCSLPSPHCS